MAQLQTTAITGSVSASAEITAVSFTSSRATGVGFFGTASFALTASGATGTSGTSGTAGSAGTSGSSGTSGSTGSSGSAGTAGSSGTSGTRGSSGSSGTSGANGSSGSSGATGGSGSSGSSGATGGSGSSGSSGATGASGSSGSAGSSGTSGTRGSSGSSGTTGANGSSGSSGTSASVTINNNTDNYLVTATGTTNTLNGESTVTLDGTTFTANTTNFVVNSTNITVGNDTTDIVSIAGNTVRVTGNNVGIGTTAPVYTLHLAAADTKNTYPTTASINITNTNSAAFSRTMGVNFSVGAGAATEVFAGVYGVYTTYTTTVGGAIAFVTNNGSNSFTEKMRISSNGNVGVGTTGPLHKVHITQALDGNFPTLGTGKGALFIAGDTNLYGMYLGVNTTTGDGFIQTMRNDAATAYNLILNSAGGNVGIGTTTIPSRLSISGSSNGSTPVVDIVVGGTDAFSRGVRMINSSMTNGSSLMYAVGRQDAARNMGQFYFVYTADGSTSNRLSMGLHSVDDIFTIAGTGNVGISNTAPSYKLDVNGPTRIEGGSANWNETTPGTSTGTIHLDPGVATDNFGNAITFGASDTGNGETAQAGIYIRSDGGYGTKMYFATTDSYVSGAKTRMYISEGGLVGIGTTSPETTLHVNGQLTLKSSGEGGPYIYRDGSNAGDVRFYSTNGTFASPTAKVAEGLLGQIHYAGYTGTAYKTAAQIWAVVDGSVTSTVVPGRIDFKTSNSSSDPTTRMTIKSDGNVGINTTSPDQKLHVIGNIRLGESANRSIIFHTSTNGIDYINGSGNKFTITDYESVEFFKAEYVSGGTSKRSSMLGALYVINTGIVGIGTTSPVERLTVANTGTSDIISAYRTQNTSGNLSGIAFAQQNASSAKINYAAIYSRISSNTAGAESGDISFYTYSSGTNAERGRLTSVGTFYMGSAGVDSGAISAYVTGYNGFAAQVSNNAFFTYSGLNLSGTRTFVVTGAGALTVSGDVVAYGTPSDVSYKHDVQQLTNALDIVRRLRGVSFKWNKDTDSHTMVNITDDLGFIAQEVREVLPTIVRENEDGKLSLRDRAIIPLLVEAIKEQQTTIQQLQARIEALETL